MTIIFSDRTERAWRFGVSLKRMIVQSGRQGRNVEHIKRTNYFEYISRYDVETIIIRPCKIRTGILAGSRRHLGGNPVGIPARFWPPGFFFPAGISPGNEIPGGQNLAGILPRISPRFSPGSKNPGGQNLAGILPRISPRFSPRRKNPGGQNLGAIRPRILPRFSSGSNNPGGQNLAGMLPRISPRYSPRSYITVAKISARSCRESRQVWRREAKFLVRFTAGISAKF